jgi:phosphoenolpyruvate carboxykinase (ATP)
VINLSPETEPDIYRTTQMFGTVLENVVPIRHQEGPLRRPVDHGNTRARIPSHISNYVESGVVDIPERIFLTATHSEAADRQADSQQAM